MAAFFWLKEFCKATRRVSHVLFGMLPCAHLVFRKPHFLAIPTFGFAAAPNAATGACFI